MSKLDSDSTEKQYYYLEFKRFNFGKSSVKEISFGCVQLKAEAIVDDYFVERSGDRYRPLRIHVSFHQTKTSRKHKRYRVALCTISAFLKDSTKLILGSTTELSCNHPNHTVEYDFSSTEDLNRILIDICYDQHDKCIQQLQSFGDSVFKSEKYSDIVINVRGNKFPAHRIILAATSPVFEALFSGKFKENAMKEVKIENFSLETISEMVRFMYTGELTSSQSNISIRNLYAASDYYDIKELKSLCTQELLSTLNVANAFDVLFLVETHNDDQLKKRVIDFICKNPSCVTNAEKWANIIQKRPELLKDILECKAKQ